MAIAELVFLRGDQILLHVRLDRAEVCIGSHPTNDVVVPESTISDVAALLIDRGAHRYLLRDLTGGKLRVRGQPLEAEGELEIGDGDVIGIGPFALKLQVRSEEDQAVRNKLSRTALLGTDDRAGVEGMVSFRGERHLVRPERPFNIGSDEDNDLVITDEFVSSYHCRIHLENGRWFVTDLESTNGTEVNGLKVREAELPLPATIRLGRAVLQFDVPSRTPETAEPLPRPDRPSRGTFHGMVADSAAMRRVFDLISRLSSAREPVLIVGESGSGKELVAQALHERSGRKTKPYLALNCGALSSGLIEGELFGYMKGSFTGAAGDKMGAFEACDGGTLFLDEIGELPLELQPKLLRVLESSKVRRIGGVRELAIDTRVVAATHRNLEELVADGEFREDLFHRLFVLSIPIPPLRDRVEDILPLVRHFLSTQAPERKLALEPEAEEALTTYSWPGNIRELRNVIVRAILMTDGEVIHASDLQFSKDAFSKSGRDARGAIRQIEQEEREKMIRVLEQTDGNRAEAARMLGLSKSTFHDRLKRYGIPLKK